MNRKLVALVIFAFALSGCALAGDIGVNFSSPGQQNSPSVWNLGYEFMANSNSTVTGLGVFDYNQDGFSQPQQVGLWSTSGVLLASAYVSNSDPLNGFWRFAPIAGVTLQAGQTYIVGSQGGEGYTWYTNGFTVAPEITYLHDEWVYLGNTSNNPLVMPNTTDGITAAQGGGFFGGNIEFGTTSVPEPASMFLLGSGLLGLGNLARRRMNKR